MSSRYTFPDQGLARHYLRKKYTIKGGILQYMRKIICSYGEVRRLKSPLRQRAEELQNELNDVMDMLEKESQSDTESRYKKIMAEAELPPVGY